ETAKTQPPRLNTPPVNTPWATPSPILNTDSRKDRAGCFRMGTWLV
ncbi:hypothetical protein HMPREF0580_1958, partial [Mobiluncus mulieris ATCC 35239]